MKGFLVTACLCWAGMFGISSCNNQPTGEAGRQDSSAMTKKFSISARPFGKLDSTEVTEYTLTNPAGMVVKLLNYGGTVTSILVPDNKGVNGDVILGFDSLAGYRQAGNPYIGALVGRYANRIDHAKFRLDGKTYSLGANDHGNTLHGGWKGFDKVIWQTIPRSSDSGASLKLVYESRDGEEGFPGRLHAEVVYDLTADNGLRITYTATTDKPTPVNLTNHSYFNLAAGREPDALAHDLMLNADRFTDVNDQLIPTGRLPAVAGTPMDFTRAKKIGRDLGKVKGGYDHNFVLNKKPGDFALAARVYDSLTGRVMEVYTTEPGLQFYTGNFLDGTLRGKNGMSYVQHYGICLEAQHFPNSPNQPSFPNTILHPGEVYRQVTLYKFFVK